MRNGTGREIASFLEFDVDSSDNESWREDMQSDAPEQLKICGLEDGQNEG